jgi:hypothetical protein
MGSFGCAKTDRLIDLTMIAGDRHLRFAGEPKRD